LTIDSKISQQSVLVEGPLLMIISKELNSLPVLASPASETSNSYPLHASPPRKLETCRASQAQPEEAQRKKIKCIKA
jgi:hypothetical protein